MHTLWGDLRHAIRSLRRSPYVTVAAALAIGLAVGATTAVFSWMDGFVLHPFLGVSDQTRLVGLEVGPPNGGMGAWSYQTFKELRDGTQSFAGMAAWRIIRVSAREPGEAASVPVLATTVSGNYFDVLGIKPSLGRGIVDADVDAIAPVAVLGYQYWRDRFREDASVIGRTLLLNSQAVTVVGIAPPGFSGVYTGVVPHLYVPLTLQPRLSGVNTLDDRKLRSWLLFARLAPGVSIDAARGDADAVARRISSGYGDRPVTGSTVMDLRVQFLGRTLSPLFAAMLAVSGLLVVLASANVAGLLLVRADARRGEVALRRALGGSRWRVIQTVLLESGLLAAAGSALGFGAAYAARGVLYSLLPRGVFPISLPIPINWRVLVVSLIAALVVTIACGLGPAFAAMRVSAPEALRVGARSVAGGRGRLRAAIVSGQLALCVLALVLAGMFMRGLRAASSIDVGFSDPAHVLLVDTDFGAARFTGSRGVAALEELLMRLRGLPGIQSATVASMVPLGFGGRRIVEMSVEGYTPAPNDDMSAERAHVGPDYAATMKIAVLRGRDLRDDDRAGTELVTLVNEAFVKRFLGNGDPIGRRINPGNGWTTVVGVLHDGKYDRLDEPLHPVVYVPTAQWFLPAMTIHVRTTIDAHALAEPVRRELALVHVDLPAVQARTLEEHIAASTFVPRTGSTVIGAFALIALVLSVVGLYGVLAFSVALRAREIAIRMALGAAERSIAWSVARHAASIVGLGALGGGVLASVCGPLLRARMSGVGSADPLIGAGAALILVVATVIAVWVPARRAVRVDPAVALRGE